MSAKEEEYKQLNIRLPKKLINELKIISIERNISLNLCVSRVLFRYIHEERKYKKMPIDNT